MVATSLQERAEIGWDLRTIDVPLQAHEQLFVLLLWALLIVALVIVIRLWLRLGIRQARILGQLDELADMLEAGGKQDIAQLAHRVPTGSPEQGLTDLPAVIPEEGSAGLRRVLGRADALCRREYATLRVTIGRLLTTSVVAAFASVVYFASDLVYVFQAIQLEKAVSWRAVSGELAGTMLLICFGMLLSAFIFIAYRHFSARLGIRQSYWKYFCERCSTFLSKS